MHYTELPLEIRQAALEENLFLIGITDAMESEEEKDHYMAFIDHGFQAKMESLIEHADKKFNPVRILSDCKSLILFGLNYYQKKKGPVPKTHGKISLYAWGHNSQELFIAKLERILALFKKAFPDEEFKALSDASPLAEKCYAGKAGLGFRGKHSILINPELGSRFFIGEILSTIALSPEMATSAHQGPNQCPEECTKCIDACPTKAIVQPYVLDASKCISYLTIAPNPDVTPELEERIGNWLYQCDICQDVCPFNRKLKITEEPAFLEHKTGPGLELEEIFQIKTEEKFRKKFKGTDLLRLSRSKLICNALVEARNKKDKTLIPPIKDLTKDSDPLIAERAEKTLEQL